MLGDTVPDASRQSHLHVTVPFVHSEFYECSTSDFLLPRSDANKLRLYDSCRGME
jgi:hypothetical protein